MHRFGPSSLVRPISQFSIEHDPTPTPAEEPTAAEEPAPVTIENLKAELRALGHDKLLELARVLNVGQ